jgi:uncharacterized membrane protein YagU involved in acid resistance
MSLTTVIETFVAGFVGAISMSAVMGAIHATGYANADMIRALGSLVTRKVEGSFGMGLAIHLLSGMLFAIPYTLVLGGMPTKSLLMSAGLGAMIGLAHGLLMSLVLLGMVTERHPVPRFRVAGFEVAIAHIAGHVAYGIGVGVVAHALSIDWGLHMGAAA